MFLARTDEQRRFERSLVELESASATVGPSSVLLVHGLGGMGKTELCKRFTAIAEGTLPDPNFGTGKFLSINVNWQDERHNHGAGPAGFQPREALAVIYDRTTNHPSVRNNRRWRKGVARAFDAYRRIAHESATLERSLRPLSDALTGDAANALDPGAAVARAVEAIRTSRNALESEQAGLLGRTNDSLVREFAEGLRMLSRRRSIIVILDHYEIVANCGSWLRQAMLSSGHRVMWVVAARIEPESEAGGSGEMASFHRQISEQDLQLIEMSTFSETTIGEELTQRGVTNVDAATLDAVKTLTRGVPMAVSIVAGMLAQGKDLTEISRSVSEAGDTTELVRRLARRYLVHALEDPGLAPDTPLLLDMALLYADRADAELLQAIWGRKHDLDSTLTLLADRHDFVLTTSRRLHQDVRETFRKYLLDGVRRAERQDINRRAADVAAARIDRFWSGEKIEERMEDEQLRLDVATLVWHRFWQDNESGFDALCTFFPAAILLQRAFAHELVGIAGFFKDSFGSEHQALHRGLASLLSFGGFLDGWRMERRKFLLRNTVAGPDSESAASGADQQTALACLLSRAECGSLALDTVPPTHSLVDLLVAKCESKSNPTAGLSALTAASGSIDPDEGNLAAEIAQTAQDIASLLVEPNHTGNFPAPTTEGMRAGELWAAYSGTHTAVLLWFGRSYRERGETDEATAAFAKAEAALEPLDDLQSRGELLDAKIARAIGLKERENDTALAIYDEVIERFGNDPNRALHHQVAIARFNRIGHFGQLHDDVDTAEEYRGYFARYVTDPQARVRKLAIDALREAARTIDQADEPIKAVRTLESVAALAKDEALDVRLAVASAYLDLGNQFDNRQEYEEAVNFYQRILGEFKDDENPEFIALKAKALFNTGLGLKHQGNMEDAIRAWNALLDAIGEGTDREMRRLKAKALLMKATLLRSINQPLDLDETHDNYRRLLAWQDTLPDTHAFYGSFLTEIGDEHETARWAFERALSMDPNNPSALSAHARLRFEEGEVQEGLKLAARSLTCSEDSSKTGLEMGFCIFAAGPKDHREESLAQIRELLDADVRCCDWETRRLLERAASEQRDDLEWLQLLAHVVTGELPLDVLEEWRSWQASATDQA
jgi:tetratricopeptide (TPR) repeat protein